MKRGILDHVILAVCLVLNVIARRRSNAGSGEIVNWNYEVNEKDAIIHVYPSSQSEKTGRESEISSGVPSTLQQVSGIFLEKSSDLFPFPL